MFLSPDRLFYISEISGSHSVVCEHSGILKGDAVLLVEWLPTFRRIIIYLPSGPRNKIPLKTKAVRSSETSETINLTTGHNIPEDLNMDGNKWWLEKNLEKKSHRRIFYELTGTHLGLRKTMTDVSLGDWFGRDSNQATSEYKPTALLNSHVKDNFQGHYPFFFFTKRGRRIALKLQLQLVYRQFCLQMTPVPQVWTIRPVTRAIFVSHNVTCTETHHELVTQKLPS